MDEATLNRAFLAAAPVDTEAKYEKALRLHKRLRFSSKGSAAFKYAMALGPMIERYEAAHLALSPPDPIEAILYRMEELEWTHTDMIPFIGSAPMVSKILNRRRKLTLKMIRQLHAALDLSMDLLTQDYEIHQYDSENAAAS